MKHILTIFLCAISTISVHAQGVFADSLRALINRERKDSARLSLMNELTRHYFFDLGKTDSAEVMANQTIEIAGKKGFHAHQINALLLLCQHFRNNGDKNAFSNKSAYALQLSRKYNLVQEEVDLLRSMSHGYFKLGIADSSVHYANSAFNTVKKYSLTEKEAELYITYARQKFESNPDSARILSLMGLRLAKSFRQTLSEARALENLGFVYRGLQLDTAMLLYNQALQLYRSCGEKKQLIRLLTVLVSMRIVIKPNSIGQQYYDEGLRLAGDLNSRLDSVDLMKQYAYWGISIGDFPASLRIFLQILERLDEQRQNDIASTMSYIGFLFTEQQDYLQALKYLSDAKLLCQKNGNDASLVWVYNQLSATYLAMNLIDSSRVYAERGYNLAQSYYKGNIPGFVLNDIGVNYGELGQYQTALNFLRKSLPELIRDGDPTNTCIATFGLAKIYNKTGPNDSCIYYAKKTLKNAQSIGLLMFIVKSANLLTEVYKSQHNIDSAFYYQQIGIAAKDSLFSLDKQRQVSDVVFTRQLQQKEVDQAVEKAKLQYSNSLKLYFLGGGLGILLVTASVLLYNNRQKQRARTKIEKAYADLKSTQAQLIQSEKMASLGELTAGIAHEIQNPLNFVNNFSEVNKELLVEMKGEIDKGNLVEVTAIANDIIDNEEKISHHGKRADSIVKGMLQHSHDSSGQKELTDINALADKYLRLSYHGMRAKDKSFNAVLETNFDKGLDKISIIPQDIGRVLLNLYNNAFYSMMEKAKLNHSEYEPTISVTTRKMDGKVNITVRDNGTGIPDKIKDKIFQPFFTTKPAGSGTGLGLSLSYDIITKEHGGEIKVESKEGLGTEFTLFLPAN